MSLDRTVLGCHDSPDYLSKFVLKDVPMQKFRLILVATTFDKASRSPCFYSLSIRSDVSSSNELAMKIVETREVKSKFPGNEGESEIGRTENGFRELIIR